jgi:hypothetical protein
MKHLFEAFCHLTEAFLIAANTSIDPPPAASLKEGGGPQELHYY